MRKLYFVIWLILWLVKVTLSFLTLVSCLRLFVSNAERLFGLSLCRRCEYSDVTCIVCMYF